MNLRWSRVLGFNALAALLAVPFVAFVKIGRQPYRPSAFAERVRLLSDVPGIEESWRIPPTVALASVVVAILATVAPGRWHRWLLPVAAVVAAIAAALSYRLTASSELATAQIGVHLVAVAGALLLGATTLSYFEQ